MQFFFIYIKISTGKLFEISLKISEKSNKTMSVYFNKHKSLPFPHILIILTRRVVFVVCVDLFSRIQQISTDLTSIENIRGLMDF